MSLKNSKLIALLSAGAMVVSSMSGLIVNGGTALAEINGRDPKLFENELKGLVIIDPDWVEVEAGEAGIVGLPGEDGEQYFYGRTENQTDRQKKNDTNMKGVRYGYWNGNNPLNGTGIDYVSTGAQTNYQILLNDGGQGGVQNANPDKPVSYEKYFQNAGHQYGSTYTHTFGVFRYNPNMKQVDVYNARGNLIRQRVTVYSDYDTNGDNRLDATDGTLTRAALMAGELCDPVDGNMYTPEQLGLNPTSDEPNTTGFLYAGVQVFGSHEGQYWLEALDSFVQGQVQTTGGTVNLINGQQVIDADLVPLRDYNDKVDNGAKDNANFGTGSDKITWTSSDPSIVEIIYDESPRTGEWIKYHVHKPGEAKVTMNWEYSLATNDANHNTPVKGSYTMTIRVIGLPQGVEIQRGGDALNQWGITNSQVSSGSYEVDNGGARVDDYLAGAGGQKVDVPNGGAIAQNAYKFILDQGNWNFVAQADIFDEFSESGIQNYQFTYTNTRKVLPDAFVEDWTVIPTQLRRVKENGGLSLATDQTIGDYFDTANKRNSVVDGTDYGDINRYWGAGNSTVQGEPFADVQRTTGNPTNDQIDGKMDNGPSGELKTPNAWGIGWGGNVFGYRYGLDESYRIARRFETQSWLSDKTNLEIQSRDKYGLPTTRVVARTVAPKYDSFRVAYYVRTAQKFKDRNFDFGVAARNNLDLTNKTDRVSSDTENWIKNLGRPWLLDFNPARHVKLDIIVANATGDRVDARIMKRASDNGQAGNNTVLTFNGLDGVRNYVTGDGEFRVVAVNTNAINSFAQDKKGQDGYVIDEKTVTVQIGGMQTTVNYAIADDATLAVDNAAPATGVAVGAADKKQIGVIALENAVPGVLTVNVSVQKDGVTLDTKPLHINVTTREAANNAAAAPAVGSDFTIADVGSYRVTGDGTVELVRYLNGPTATVNTVEYKGVTYKVTSVGDRAFAGLDKLTTVTLGENVATLGKGVFKNCKNLRHVYITGASITAGKNMFYQCGKVTLHGDAAKTIDSSLFHNNKVKVK